MASNTTPAPAIGHAVIAPIVAAAIPDRGSGIGVEQYKIALLRRLMHLAVKTLNAKLATACVRLRCEEAWCMGSMYDAEVVGEFCRKVAPFLQSDAQRFYVALLLDTVTAEEEVEEAGTSSASV